MTTNIHVLTPDQRRAYHEDREFLSDRYRVVLDARITLGLSYKQTAVMLGIPIGTVRSRVHRGFAELNELGTFEMKLLEVNSTDALFVEFVCKNIEMIKKAFGA